VSSGTLNSSIPYAPNAVCLGEYARSPMGLKVGDRVKIDVDVQRLEELQRQRDAWEPELIKVTSASAAVVCTQKPTGDRQLVGVISAKEVYVFIGVCLFVSRIPQKLLSQLSPDSVERWHIGCGRTR